MPGLRARRLRFIGWIPFGRLLVGVILIAAIAREAGAVEFPDAFRATIEAGVASHRFQGVAVARIDHDERAEFYFGAIEPGGRPPEAADAFEIASSTRPFTGLLLAEALIAGKLRLDESLKQCFPKLRFADAKLAATTLEALATHRSGLPPLPSNLFPRFVDDPYADYDDAALMAYLEHAHLDPRGIGRFRYSDLGIAVLGAAIHRAYGDASRDPRHLIALDVLAPLGLKASGFGSVPRLIDGWHDGETALHWQYQALAPAAGLRATLADLEAFVAAQLKPGSSPLRAGILLARQPRATAGGGETSLAWQVVSVTSGDQSWPLLWQAGVSGGFASFIGFRTDTQQGLVMLGNGRADLSAIGLALLAGEHAPDPPRAHRRLSLDALKEYEGWYGLDAGGDLVVRARANGLDVQQGGSLPAAAVAYDDDAFVFEGEAGQITFERSASGVTGAILHRGGVNLHASRESEGAPTLKRNRVALGANALAAYAGDYAFSPSLRARVTVATPGLRAQLSGGEPVLLESCASDRFCDADGTIEIAFDVDARAKRASTLDWRQGVFEAGAKRDDW